MLNGSQVLKVIAAIAIALSFVVVDVRQLNATPPGEPGPRLEGNQ
jgi:hypothetical protein